MCGVACAFNASSILSKEDFFSRTQILNHRGPDNQDIWHDESSRCMLGHTRLSILDLNPTGNQPMISSSGRYVISYNGEIYNFDELRAAITKNNSTFRTRGSSDTEILLAGIESLGLKTVLNMVKGMFAIILFDRKQSNIYLIRDISGEKPIYYYSSGNTLIAASELKFFKFLKNRLSISKKALSVFLSQGNVPAPYSIFNEIKKVMPGTFISFSSSGSFEETKYWDIKSLKQTSKSKNEINDEFERLFLKSIKSQMVADVPLGAFLSGGIDSTSVVAGMIENSSKPIKTITIGFNEDDYDESNRSREIAKFLGTDHEEYFVTEEDAKNFVPYINSISCEPFADSSIIPTYFLTKYARNTLTVCLSGDGGDELFGGYRRHIQIARLEKILFKLPNSLKSFAISIIKMFLIRNATKFTNSISKSIFDISSFDDQIFKVIRVLNASDLRDLYYQLLFQLNKNDRIVNEESWSDPSKIIDEITQIEIRSIEDIRRSDFLNYLSNDILVKVDRSAMSNSLETRIPFLDRELIEFAFKLRMKDLSIKNTGKLPVRNFLKTRVPDTLINQPKTGFGIPLKSWLSGPLKEWAEDLIESSSFDYINKSVVKNLWKGMISENEFNQHKLWNILIFYSWHESYFD